MNNCSINTKYDSTCLKFETLKKIVTKINNDDKYKNIQNINISKYTNKNKKKLLNNIKKKLSCNIKDFDFCILSKEQEFYNILKEDFKPKGPIMNNEWLSTLDIINVMTHYEKKYKNFEFLGPFPIDFYFIYKDFQNMNLKKMFKNKTKIGMIFNTDISTGNGEHWISLYIDLENKNIYFFDSVGEEPPKEIKKLINDIKIKMKKNDNIKLKININKKQYQYDNSSCGIYSLWFIINKLKNKKNINVNDNFMYKKRKEYFRK